MAEMVDAHDSGSCDLLVQVQVLFGAPLNKAPVAELVDAHAWGACERSCKFKSCLVHHL